MLNASAIICVTERVNNYSRKSAVAEKIDLPLIHTIRNGLGAEKSGEKSVEAHAVLFVTHVFSADCQPAPNSSRC